MYYLNFKSIPPSKELALLRSKLTVANENNALIYSKVEYKKANRYYDSAMIFWKKENETFFPFRDYSLSKYYADQADYWASVSAKKIIEKKNNHIHSLNTLLNSVEWKIVYYKKIYGRLPVSEKKVQQLARARMLYQEAGISIVSKNWNSAEDKLKASEKIIDKLYKTQYNTLKIYFQDYPLWSSISNSAIEDSKKRNNALILIDKYARKCHLIQGGQIIQSYDIELGINWIGNKKYNGDKTTPEGVYKLLNKKGNGETRFHKAMLINYPNDKDKARFAYNKAKGVIPGKESIGNLIEIHGHGGKGSDWTDGCIALKDADMDNLYSACNEGTPVIIVGSLKSLDEILK